MTVDGQWKIVVESPMGPQEATATLASEGRALTGTAVSLFGASTLEDGVIDGDRATWTVNMVLPFPMALKYEARFDGDQVVGTVDTGMFGRAPFRGVKVA